MKDATSLRAGYPRFPCMGRCTFGMFRSNPQRSRAPDRAVSRQVWTASSASAAGVPPNSMRVRTTVYLQAADTRNESSHNSTRDKPYRAPPGHPLGGYGSDGRA